MKTIKERATQASIDALGRILPADEGWLCNETHFARSDGDISKKNEPQVVGIDKACEWLKNHIDKGLVIYHDNKWCSRDEFINKFRKAILKGE